MSNHFDESKIHRAGDGTFATKGFSEADGGTETDLSTEVADPAPSFAGGIHDRMLREDEVTAEVAAGTISAAAAKTIASWWHSPGTEHITRLSHGKEFSYEGLEQEVQLERRWNTSERYDAELKALHAWAQNKGQRPSTAASDPVAPGEYGREGDALIRQRGQIAHLKAQLTRQPVLVDLNTVEPNHIDYDLQGANVELDENGTETASGDFSIGREPSIRYTWATGDDDRPFMSTTVRAHVEATYTNGEGVLCHLTSKTREQVSQEIAARYIDWEIEHGRLDRVYRNAAGKDAQQKAYRARNAHLRTAPVINYSVRAQTETIGHHVAEDVGGSLIDHHYARGEIAADLTTLHDAEHRAVAHIRGIGPDRARPGEHDTGDTSR